MKFLLVVKQKKNIDTFAATIRALLDRGHQVTLTVQEGQELRHDSVSEQLARLDRAVAAAYSDPIERAHAEAPDHLGIGGAAR